MPTIVSQCSASNHDCLIYKDIFNNWQFKLNTNYIATGCKSGGQKSQCSGLYFPNIPIPPGAKVLSAYLILRASDTNTWWDSFASIRLQNNPSPAPFSDLIDWQSRSWCAVRDTHIYHEEDWLKDTLYVSRSIENVIQQGIDNPGWTSGNPMVLFWGDEYELAETTGWDREAYSYDGKAAEAPRLEITFTLPAPAPPPPPPYPLPVPPPPPRKGWAALDLQYEYLDDGFKLTLYTDVPCHLYCRMTTTPPRKHSLPVMRRGLRLTGDIRFCFVVYEDNEQEESGDTLIHTFYKGAWPVCEFRWFYFVGSAYGDTSQSETAIFKFHFPAPPPAPPPPIIHYYFDTGANRYMGSNSVNFNACWGGTDLEIYPYHDPPKCQLAVDTYLTASYFIRRSFHYFNTAGFSKTAKVLEAALYVYVWYKLFNSGWDQPYLYITRGVQSTPLVTSDWSLQNPITTVHGQIDQRTFVLSQYNKIPITPDNFYYFNPTGITQYCLRDQKDVLKSAPPLGGHLMAYYSNQKGAGYRPYLEIKYYPA